MRKSREKNKHCIHGSYCRYWLEGRCRFYHDECLHREECGNRKQGDCKYYQPEPEPYVFVDTFGNFY